MNAQVEHTNQFSTSTLHHSEIKYYEEAKRRLGLLRIMGLLDGTINVTQIEVQQWIEDRDNDPVCAQLDSFACQKIFELK